MLWEDTEKGAILRKMSLLGIKYAESSGYHSREMEKTCTKIIQIITRFTEKLQVYFAILMGQ